jgi:anti-anti-sigma factor
MNLIFSETSNENQSVLSLEGKIISDMDTAPLLEQLQSIIEKETNSIIFDLSKLTHITSTGLNFFVRSLTRARNNDKKLVICGLQPVVSKLFQISKLNEIFTITEDVSSAIKTLNSN